MGTNTSLATTWSWRTCWTSSFNIIRRITEHFIRIKIPRSQGPISQDDGPACVESRVTILTAEFTTNARWVKVFDSLWIEQTYFPAILPNLVAESVVRERLVFEFKQAYIGRPLDEEDIRSPLLRVQTCFWTLQPAFSPPKDDHYATWYTARRTLASTVGNYMRREAGLR